MTTIYLGGKLGTLFGKRWDLLVNNPAEAMRAIDVNTRGRFRTYLAKDGDRKFYKVAIGRKDGLIGADELGHRSGRSTIHIMPTIRGANSGIGKIIAGAVLVIIGVIADIETFGTTGNGLIQAGATAFIGLGASLILGGITQLLTPVPKQTQQLQSYNFQGNATTVNQGGPVPLFYGRGLCTPIPISINFDSADTQATANTQLGTVDSIPLIGGGFQYVPGTPVSNTNSDGSS